MIGVALGGNKVRKLEFLLADAHANGADVVLTAGGPQSNHAMLTAACAAKLGMKSILVLKKRGELTGGNQILDRIYGADVRFVDTDTYDDVYAEMERIMDELRKAGHTPYFIPVGGSVPLGSLGYVNCAKEIAEQAQALGVKFDSIVSATGSGGTYAGLTYGAKLFLPGTRSVGVGVCDDPFADIAYDLMGGLKELLESDVPVQAVRTFTSNSTSAPVMPLQVRGLCCRPQAGAQGRHPGRSCLHRKGAGGLLPADRGWLL